MQLYIININKKYIKIYKKYIKNIYSPSTIFFPFFFPFIIGFST